MPKNIRVKFWGVRGSLPVPGGKTAKFGGNTTCVEVQCGREHFIIDAGSGIRELGESLMPFAPVKINLLFTHYHWDHIMGLPFFTPLFVSGNEFQMYGESKKKLTVKDIIAGQMVYPYFPVTPKAFRAKLAFHSFEAGKKFRFGDVLVSTAAANHPFGAVAYRFDWQGSSLVHLCDYEHFPHPDEPLLDFCRGADAVTYDAAFTPEEYANGRKGWGHSTWADGCQFAKDAAIGRIWLVHHDIVHDDNFMHNVAGLAKQQFKNAIVIKEKQEFWL